jgi:uncharacterized protein (TIGR02600 family)
MITAIPLRRSKQKGVALIIVVSILGLLMLLTLALFTLSEGELKGAKHYANTHQARQISDVAVNVAISQLRKGTRQNDAVSGRELWTSQPGLLRRYSATGELQTAFKLYSSSNMVVDGSTPGAAASLLNDTPPADWASLPERYVDLNRPIARADANGTPRLRFPIIDPRSMTGGPDTVSGFAYSDSFANGRSLDGVVTSGGDTQRLPMPVEWLYVLRDGSLGVLDNTNTFVGATTPTAENPIVGRVAFWSDDESGKVNINTASEPTPWAVPTFFHKTDGDYALYQPANGEFQRYPGHPATTALSPILFPGKSLTWADKELIYNLSPKVGPGGTMGATKSYDDPAIEAVNLALHRSERLYASLDEFLLKEDRTRNNFGSANVGPETLQRTNFFLTAHSKAPESNPFGLPKIAMWPVSYRGAEYRTSFDNLIAFCATLLRQGSSTNKREYLFQRADADSPTADITHAANQELIAYLRHLLQSPMPGYASTADKNFRNKYGDDLHQIMVQIFDYIRSTNLHDPHLAERIDRLGAGEATANIILGYTPSYDRPFDFKTFTDPRFVQSGSVDEDTGETIENENLGFPGHGQVTPSHLEYNGKTYNGLGRFPTISEVGLHFIAVADNSNDRTSAGDIPNGVPPGDTLNPIPAIGNTGRPGGVSAMKLNSTDNNVYDRWYSNFPPNPHPNPKLGEPAKPGVYNKAGQNGFPYGNDPNHPGYQPQNWNWQLSNNTPLPYGTRRIQARVLLEFFTPAVGYTLLCPEFSVRISGLGKFQVKGGNGDVYKPLFPNDVEIFRTGRHATHNGANQTGGFSMGVKGQLRERGAPARFPMPADDLWGQNGWLVTPSSQSGGQLGVLNYDLLSNYVDIIVGPQAGQNLTISSGDIKIEIFSGHLDKNPVGPLNTKPELVQTLHLNFEENTVAPPTLIRNPIARLPDNATQNPNNFPPVEPPYWWSFHSKGALGFGRDATLQPKGDGTFRFVSPTLPNDANGDLTLVRNTPRAKVSDAKGEYPIGGRYFGTNVNDLLGTTNEVRRGALIYGYDAKANNARHPHRPRHATNADPNQPYIDDAEQRQGCDVVQTMIVKHGDYRLTAAKHVVPASDWAKHRNWGVKRLAHSFSHLTGEQVPGYDYGDSLTYDYMLVPNNSSQRYANNRTPDFPNTPEAAAAVHRYFDFDNGYGPHRDGPYINKPDEGNLDALNGIAYFEAPNRHTSPKEAFFTPNRQIPSPVTLGSLPAGVHADDPWRTLLFRPQENHPGGPEHLGGSNPPDHMLLEFFWMPVVEPYAISEPFSTAGKINLNYQILPFTNIKRSSGLHAVLAHERITAVSEADIADYKAWRSGAGNFWRDSDSKTWHYDIDVDKTLAQFEERFATGKNFLSPSEICDIHLIPKNVNNVHSAADMAGFWSTRRLTGDNTRERPYGNIYPRLTTRSNTFRVHYVAQVIAKARSTDPTKIEPADKPTSEHRGSTVIERYLDPSQPNLPDFATSVPNATTSETLDDYHQFRIIETKKFGS